MSSEDEKPQDPIYWTAIPPYKTAPDEKAPGLTAIFNYVQKELAPRNQKAREILTRQIEEVAAKKDITADARKPPEPLTRSSLPLQPQALKAGAILTFECSPELTDKVRKLKSTTGEAMFEETRGADGRKHVGVWNAGKQGRDVYDEVYAERGKDTRIQYSAYYDKANDRLTINLGGTDFTDSEDRKSVAQTTIGAVDMRMTAVKGLIDKTMAAFEKEHPGKLPHVAVDVYAHSAGANGIALVNYYLQREHGIVPRAQVTFDGYGEDNSFNNVAEIAARAEGRSKQEVLAGLRGNTMNYKVVNGTFVDETAALDKYNTTGPGHAAKLVGPVEKLDIQGGTMGAHKGESWIRFFDEADVRQVNDPDNIETRQRALVTTGGGAMPQMPEVNGQKMEITKALRIPEFRDRLRASMVSVGTDEAKDIIARIDAFDQLEKHRLKAVEERNYRESVSDAPTAMRSAPLNPGDAKSWGVGDAPKHPHVQSLQERLNAMDSSQTKALLEDGTLPQTVRLNGREVSLQEALRDPAFNSHFRDQIAKTGENAMALMAKVDQFDSLEREKKYATKVADTLPSSPDVKADSPKPQRQLIAFRDGPGGRP